MRLAFTATRGQPKGKLSNDDMSVIVDRLQLLAEELNVTEVTTGGAIGGDSFIATMSWALWPSAFHRLVLPAPSTSTFVEICETWLENGWIEGEIIRTELSPLKRNHVILDHGDRLEAFPLTAVEQWRGSGTWATWRYAGEREMPRFLTPLRTN